jgi:hypothetical protein
VYRVWATAHRVGDHAPLPAAAAAPSRLTPVNPVRVLDTRRTGIVGAGGVVEVALATLVPAAATSVVVNVTATVAVGLTADNWGYLTVYPCDDEVPEASSVNYGPVESVAGSAYVGTDCGAICVYTSARAGVIVDLQSRFEPGGAASVAARPTRTRHPQHDRWLGADPWRRSGSRHRGLPSTGPWPPPVR